MLAIGGATLLDLGERARSTTPCSRRWSCTYAFIALLLRSRFGHALAGIRVNEQRMRAAGFSTTPYKLAAFVVAGALAGLAGLLLAVKDGAVNPELLSWHESGAVLLMLIFGGIGSLRGAVLGAVAFTLLKELFQSEALLGPLAAHWQLTLGLTIIAFVAALPRGLIGLGARVRGLVGARRIDRRARAPRGEARADRTRDGRPKRRAARGAASAPLLEAIGLGRRFRGLAAVDDVSIDVCASARSTPSSAPTAPASRRSSTCSRASSRRAPAASASPATT